ncbi:MAG: DUF502 domain-containing protein [Verrucomicrobia bacterium]|nr:DUF502 domain-containing protein [Verrucomicrobiota bacterium]
MKKYLITGFITLLPLALTIIIAIWLFNLFTDPFAGLIESLIVTYQKSLGLSVEKHVTLVNFLSRVCSLIFLFLLILFLGYCGRKFLLHYFLKFADKLFSRIPLVRTIYKLCNDLTQAILSDTAKTFKQTVLVPFPHPALHSIGFITAETPEIFRSQGQGTDLAIFVPTAPHPMSGFVLLCPKDYATPVPVSTEDAFKFLISCGVIHPGEQIPSKKETI